jgi:hypothetical protein
MADEEVKEGGGEKKEGGGLIFRIAIIAVILIVPLVAAIVTWQLVLAPQLAASDEDPMPEDDAQALAANAVTVAFEQQYASLIPSDPQFPAATLIYSIGLECANPETAGLVELHRERFQSVVTEKHRHLNRDEAEDRLLIESIEKQILLEANDLLKRYQASPAPEIRIIDVFHSQWYVTD